MTTTEHRHRYLLPEAHLAVANRARPEGCPIEGCEGHIDCVEKPNGCTAYSHNVYRHQSEMFAAYIVKGRQRAGAVRSARAREQAAARREQAG